MIEPDPWLLGLSVALDGPDRAEVLDELGDLGLEGQTLNEDLHLGANAGGVRVRLLEPTTTAATATPTAAATAAPAAKTATAPVAHFKSA